MHTMQVPSSDGVQVMVYELAPWSRPGEPDDRRVLLMSHATGFHGRCWSPVADPLATRYRCVALDYRGHGATAVAAGWQVDWDRYGDDAEAVAVMAASLNSAEGLLGVGHSMGGACLLMAAHRQPALFRGLVLFEPIVFPTDRPRPDTGNPLVEGARRRRRRFPSLAEAEANYAAKPPMAAFTAQARRAYVEGGFHPTDDGEVELACAPETEAGTFEAGASHRTWDLLPHIDIPVLVVAGRIQPHQPAAIAVEVAGRLPQGRYLEDTSMDHFGPMTHPERVAALITEFDDSLA
jgi:pimeloyl-ACP methyl ester carboxylesterase